MKHRAFPVYNCPEIVLEARATEPRDWMISPFDEDGYSAFFDVAPMALRVLETAMEVEADVIQARSWYRDTRIAELGDLTAAQMVSQGRADQVMVFLRAVLDGKRD